MRTKRTQTKIQIVKIDQTKHWSDKITKEIGKIYTIYLYDKSVITYLSELTPSYYLIPLYYSTEFGEHKYSEQVAEDIQSEFSNEEPIYMHCKDVDKLEHYPLCFPRFRQDTLNKWCAGRKSKAYATFMEETKEYFTANHTF